MKTNDEGRALIKSCEGLRLEAYRDLGGIWTIGWGHTGRDVTPGMKITEEEAERLFDEDLETFENGVWALTKAHQPTENQFAALVSLAFNIGLGNFQTSSVLRTFRAGDLEGAKASFAVWHKGGGKPGVLMRRRLIEASLFGKDTQWPAHPRSPAVPPLSSGLSASPSSRSPAVPPLK